MDMLSLAETRYNLSRKGMFKTKTSVNKITSFKPVRPTRCSTRRSAPRCSQLSPALRLHAQVAIKMPLLADLSRELAATVRAVQATRPLLPLPRV